MKAYKAVVFDFDMTLADTATVNTSLLNQTAVEFGYRSGPSGKLPLDRQYA